MKLYWAWHDGNQTAGEKYGSMEIFVNTIYVDVDLCVRLTYAVAMTKEYRDQWTTYFNSEQHRLPEIMVERPTDVVLEQN